MRVVLTDLTTKRWQGVNMSNIQRVVDEFIGSEVLGEIGSEDIYVSLSNVTHIIKDIKIEDNKIKGDLQFLNSFKGIEAQELFDMGLLKLSIRALGIPPSDIHKIITWDLVFDEDFKMKKRLEKIDKILEIITEYENIDNV